MTWLDFRETYSISSLPIESIGHDTSTGIDRRALMASFRVSEDSELHGGTHMGTRRAQPAPATADESITLTGRLCADPVLRHTASGVAVANLRIAVNPPEGGEASFHDVVVWQRSAEVVAKFLRKGRLVEVTGRPGARSWTDKDGNKRERVEINAFRVQFVSRAVSAPSAENDGVEL